MTLLTWISFFLAGFSLNPLTKNISILPGDSSSSLAVLYVFEGSDWCNNCQRLEKKVLQDSMFIRLLREHQVKIEIVDFPQRKKLTREQEEYNSSLAEKYGFNGTFPTLIIARDDLGKYKPVAYNEESGEEFARTVINELQTLHE